MNGFQLQRLVLATALRLDFLVRKFLTMSVQSLPHSLIPVSQHRLVEILKPLPHRFSSAVVPWRCIARPETDVAESDPDLLCSVRAWMIYVGDVARADVNAVFNAWNNFC